MCWLTSEIDACCDGAACPEALVAAARQAELVVPVEWLCRRARGANLLELAYGLAVDLGGRRPMLFPAGGTS